MILHEKMGLPFERSLESARRRGFMKRERKLKLALDTTNVLGSGPSRTPTTCWRMRSRCWPAIWFVSPGRWPPAWAGENGLGRYFGKSIKGRTEMDWEPRHEALPWCSGSPDPSARREPQLGPLD